MAEEFSFKAVTEPFQKELEARRKATDRGSMYVVREAGRLAKRAARKAAPVYGGSSSSVRIRDVKKARKAGVNLAGQKLGKGELVEGKRVVAGLLRDSVSSSRKLANQDGTYVNKVGPRGPRVHLYARKIEVQAGFMAAAHRVVAAQMEQIAVKVLTKSTQGRR